jgi:2-oxoglutarate dehydrogenase E2 component (dihydrolipoamide succinyltransferase)
MEHPIKAPAVGESITEVRILRWIKNEGEAVSAGENVVEIETDKATVEVAAETRGALRILKPAGETINIGTVIGIVDDSQAGKASTSSSANSAPTQSAVAPPAATAISAPGAANLSHSAPVSPSVRRMASETGANLSAMGPGEGKGGRLTKGDLLRQLSGATPSTNGNISTAHKLKEVADSLGVSLDKAKDKPGDRRVALSRLRLKIAERLVEAQHTAAILTTLNEVDMGAVMELRNKTKESFKAKHGANLSFMSFFTRACVLALKEIPEVNATIDGKDIVYHDYYDVGIAVGTERGLVVPVLRGAEKMTFVDIEKSISAMAVKARDNKLTIAEMTGGTFTISNGGTYGSLMSTPILNPPQSGILGMHKIQDRPMAVNGKVEIRPMMYLALSYDHRIIDGKGAVTFLVKVKEFLENPEKLGAELS